MNNLQGVCLFRTLYVTFAAHLANDSFNHLSVQRHASKGFFEINDLTIDLILKA